MFRSSDIFIFVFFLNPQIIGCIKMYLKLHPVSYTNTHHDVTDLVNHGMVKNIKNLNILRTKHNCSTK